MIYVQLNYFLVSVRLLSSLNNYQLLKLQGLNVYWPSHASVIPCIVYWPSSTIKSQRLDHILASCSYSREVWWNILVSFGVDTSIVGSWRLRWHGQARRGADSLFALVAWERSVMLAASVESLPPCNIYS